jgi:hypothetical protein
MTAVHAKQQEVMQNTAILYNMVLLDLARKEVMKWTLFGPRCE